MPVPSGFDHAKQKRRGNSEASRAPTCRKCGKVSVLDPCRDCATAVEADGYPSLLTVENTARGPGKVWIEDPNTGAGDWIDEVDE